MKKKLLSCIIALMFVFSVPMLASCGNGISISVEKSENGKTTGGGTYKEGQTVTLEAFPNDYVTFMGWLDTQTDKILSTNQKFTFVVKNGLKVKPVFQVTMFDVLNKIMHGAMNRYTNLPQDSTQWQKFSVDTSIDFASGYITEGSEAKDLSLDVKANINLTGSGSAISLELKDGQEKPQFALYYSDEDETADYASLYIQVVDFKYGCNFLKMTDLANLFTVVQQTSFATQTQQIPADIRDLIKAALGDSADSEFIYNIIESVFKNNAFGLFGNFTATSNRASFDLYLDTVISTFGPLLEGLNIPQLELIREIFAALKQQEMPLLVLNISANFDTIQEKSVLKDINATMVQSGDFTVDFGNPVTFPSSDFSITVNDFNLDYVPEDFTPISMDISSFPKEKVNLINTESHANFDLMVSGGVYQDMEMSLYTDINPFELLKAKNGTQFDVKKLDFDKLGMINFRIFNKTTNQDYINILLDSKATKTSAVLIYANFPEKYMSNEVVINASFDIPALIEMLSPKTASANGVVAYASEQTNSVLNILNVVVNILPNISRIGQDSFDEIFVDVAQTLVSILITESNQTVTTEKIKNIFMNDVSFDKENKSINVKLVNIRKEMQLMGIDLASIVFGRADSAVIHFESFEMGTVVLENGKYIGKDGKGLVETYSTLHNVPVAIESIPELDNAKIPVGTDLKDVFVTSFTKPALDANVVFLDGTKGTFKVNLTEYKSDTDLTVVGNHKLSVSMHNEGTVVESMIYAMAKVPIGIMPYETQIEIVKPLEEEVAFNITKLANIAGYYNEGGFGAAVYTDTETGKTLEMNIKILNNNGCLIDERFVAGTFEIDVEAFGIRRKVQIVNYIKEGDLTVDGNSVDLLNENLLQTFHGPVIKVGQDVINPSMIFIGETTVDIPSADKHFIFKDGATGVSEQFRTMIYSQNIRNLYVTYIYNINGKIVRYHCLVDLIRHDEEVQYLAESVGIIPEEWFYVPMNLILNKTLNTFEMYVGDVNGAPAWSGSFTIEGDVINISAEKETGTGTISGGSIVLDLSKFLFAGKYPLPNDVQFNIV